MDDRRVGRIIREVRIRRGWRQVDLAMRAGVGQSQVSEAERGRVEHVSLATLRRMGKELDVRVSIDAWWVGGRIDQLLDHAHAGIVEETVRDLAAEGYETRVEYTFNEFGDRGSVDVLGWRPPDRTLAIVECKSRIDDVQATAASFARKVRVIPNVVRRDEGWEPSRVVRLLVIRDTHQNRDAIRQHQATFDTIWPLRTAAIRSTLAGSASGDAGGIRFLATTPPAKLQATARVRRG